MPLFCPDPLALSIPHGTAVEVGWGPSFSPQTPVLLLSPLVHWATATVVSGSVCVLQSIAQPQASFSAWNVPPSETLLSLLQFHLHGDEPHFSV